MYIPYIYLFFDKISWVFLGIRGIPPGSAPARTTMLTEEPPAPPVLLDAARYSPSVLLHGAVHTASPTRFLLPLLFQVVAGHCCLCACNCEVNNIIMRVKRPLAAAGQIRLCSALPLGRGNQALLPLCLPPSTPQKAPFHADTYKAAA